MLKSVNKGDCVRVIAESPTDGLKVGDKGYVIRDEHWEIQEKLQSCSSVSLMGL